MNSPDTTSPDAVDAYLLAAESSAALVRHPAVAAAWTEPSALAKMTVGDLAAHLARQIVGAVDVLGAPGAVGDPLTLTEHYERAAWIGADLDSDVSVFVRKRADQDAQAGPESLAARTDAALAEVRRLCADRTADRLVAAPGGWPLTVEDYLTTRVVEIVVHSDDLAHSVGVETPALPAPVTEPVLDLLVRIAARRHGTVAVLRGLARAERAPSSISAF
jgi:Mycothiol maleylpyruvate isomerase N-terminal domain